MRVPVLSMSEFDGVLDAVVTEVSSCDLLRSQSTWDFIVSRHDSLRLLTSTIMWKTVAIDEGLVLDEARLKEDPRHSSSLNALMEGCRLVMIVETSLFVTCFDVIRKIVRAYCSFVVK